MSLRIDKVASVIHKSIAKIIHEDICYPGTTITITAVQMSPDLKHASIWLSVYGRSAKKATADVLNMRKNFSRSIASTSTTKFSPKLEFYFDTSAEYADNMNRLIGDIEK